MLTPLLHAILVITSITLVVVILCNNKKFLINRFNMAVRQVMGLIPACFMYWWATDLYPGTFTGFGIVAFFCVFVFYNFVPIIALIVFTFEFIEITGEFGPSLFILIIYAIIAYITRQNERF